MDKVDDLWNDPEIGLTSFEQFYKNLVERGVHVLKPTLREWYNNKDVVQQSVKKSKPDFLPIKCPFESDCYQADLMDISRFAKSNNKFKFLLNIIHFRSRFVWSFPIKNKKPTTIAPLLESVLKHAKNLINLTTDDGNEFKGAVSKMLNKLNVTHYASTNKNNTSNIERFHGTLWGYIRRYMTAMKTLKFIDVLPKLISKYNNAKHTAIKTTPLKAYNADVPLEKLSVAKNPHNFVIGETVRLMNKRKKFDKLSFENTYSEKIYEIDGFEGNRYILKHDGKIIPKRYLERELLLVPKKIEDNATLISFTEALRTLDQINKQVRRNVKEFNGPEQTVDRHTGKVTTKQRLLPARNKRVAKAREMLDL